MSQKRSKSKGSDSAKGLWISPRLEVNRSRLTDESPGAATGARFLELADIALGLKKHHKAHKAHPHPAVTGNGNKKSGSAKKLPKPAATAAPKTVSGR